MKLYGYWRSTAAYRVRIALHLKGIEFESVPVHLVKNGGEQHLKQFSTLNPNQLVPCLVDGEFTLNQSLAIIDYLEDVSPQVALYPEDKQLKAQVKALALDIACEIHPLNNLRVQQYLTTDLGLSDEKKHDWVNYWMTKGFSAIEQQLQKTSGLYCFGDKVTVADICLVAQVYNAVRFNVDMSEYTLINAIVQRCNELPAFDKAKPENQADAVV